MSHPGFIRFHEMLNIKKEAQTKETQFKTNLVVLKYFIYNLNTETYKQVKIEIEFNDC